MSTGLWWGKLMERDDLENPGVNGRKILKRIFKKWDVVMDWIDLADNRDGWRAFVNAVMNCRVLKNPGNILTS